MDINVTTYVNQLGYGITGLNVVKALARAGHDVSLWVNGPGQIPQEDRPLFQRAMLGAQIFNPEAPSLRIAHPWDFAHHVGVAERLGLTFFETTLLSGPERHHLSALDYLYCPSAWAKGVLEENGVTAPGLVVTPLGVDASTFHPGVGGGLPVGARIENGRVIGERLEQDLRRRLTTVFLNVGKWEIRKGHDVLCTAFRAAFGESQDVHLVMACANPFLTEGQAAEWERLYTAANMTCLRERLPRQQDLARLMAFADCGVFPSRAEGWNLDLLEMLAMGKTCIATDYSAHTEFCTEGNCLLVGVDELEEAYDGVFFHGNSGEWAALGDRQEGQLVEHLRAVHRRKQAGGLAVNAAGVEAGKKFTWDNTVREMLSIF